MRLGLAGLLVASGLPAGCDSPPGTGTVKMPASVRPAMGDGGAPAKIAPQAAKRGRPLSKGFR